MYEYLGLDGVFALGAALYALSILVSLHDPADGHHPRCRCRLGAPDCAPERVMGGCPLCRRKTRDVGIILLVTVVFNIWGFPYLAMISGDRQG